MDRSCPRCKSTSYRNPTLKLMVNDCGHSLCSSCVQLLFIRGQAPCPQCQVNLKKSGFREQLFDDPMIDKEVHIRTKILKIYNNRPEDFSNEAEYDDYLEKIEDLVWATMDNEEWAKQEITDYERANQLLIRKNMAKWAKEQDTIKEQILMEKRSVEEAKIKIAKTEAEIERKRKEEEKKLLVKIEAGGDLSSIMVAKTNLDAVETDIIETKVIMHTQEAPIEVYKYEEIIVDNLGPPVPEGDDLLPYYCAIRSPAEQQIAGGFTIELGLTRALTDAFSCLAWKPTLEISTCIEGTNIKMEY